jgi:hypothetical protein
MPARFKYYFCDSCFSNEIPFTQRAGLNWQESNQGSFTCGDMIDIDPSLGAKPMPNGGGCSIPATKVLVSTGTPYMRTMRE